VDQDNSIIEHNHPDEKSSPASRRRGIQRASILSAEIIMPPCPNCHGTQITETTRQVRVMRPDIAQILRRSLKFIFIGIIAATAVLAIVVNSMAPASNDAIGHYVTIGFSLLVSIGLLAIYAKNTIMRTMHIYTCVACRKTWHQIPGDN
jgi:hypothetical protein